LIIARNVPIADKQVLLLLLEVTFLCMHYDALIIDRKYHEKIRKMDTKNTVILGVVFLIRGHLELKNDYKIVVRAIRT
jgi:hypothetical protein